MSLFLFNLFCLLNNILYGFDWKFDTKKITLNALAALIALVIIAFACEWLPARLTRIFKGG